MSAPSGKKGRKSGRQPTKAQLEKELFDVQALLSQTDEELGVCRELLATAEGRILELERANERLSMQVGNFEKAQAEADNQVVEDHSINDVSIGKSTFRLELYPHQDEHRARITHFQSEDQKIFSGTDEEAIFSFIKNHSPQPKTEQSAEAVEKELPLTPGPVMPAPVTVHKPVPASKPAPALSSEAPGTVQLRSFDLFSRGSEQPSRVLPHDQPFAAHFTLDLKDTMEPIGNLLEYKVTMYARRLSGGPKILVSEEKKQIQWTDVIAAELENMTLPAGTYRLETSVTFKLPGGAPLPVAAFLENGVVHVQ